MAGRFCSKPISLLLTPPRSLPLDLNRGSSTDSPDVHSDSVQMEEMPDSAVDEDYVDDGEVRSMYGAIRCCQFRRELLLTKVALALVNCDGMPFFIRCRVWYTWESRL